MASNTIPTQRQAMPSLLRLHSPGQTVARQARQSKTSQL